MAGWETSLEWMLNNEDPLRKYAVVPDAPDQYQTDESGEVHRIGAYAISGINSAAYPTQFQRIKALPQDQRASAVKEFYRAMFWNKWYDQIASDEVAKRSFDCAVLDGPETAVFILQRAVNALNGARIEDDGHWGPLTVAAVNNQNSAMLVDSLQAQWLGHAQAVVDKNPARARDLGTAQNPGPWWIRIMK